MRKTILFTAVVLMSATFLFTACKKEDKPTTPTNNNNNNNTGCQDGYVCFKLDGTAISKAGGGYYFADTFLFVKYEEGAKQLSIDIMGSKTGDYTVSNKQIVNNARIYWFPDNSGLMYMSETGKLNVSAYGTDKKISGTFSGTLYKYDSNTGNFTKSDSVVITEGYFTKVQLQ